MNNYEIGKTYTINPHGTNQKWESKIQKWLPYEGSQAEFVGWMRLKEKNKLPVFKFDFYSHGNPTCFTILENGRWIAGGSTIEEMLKDFHRQIDYFGSAHETILVGMYKISKDDFIKQARATSMPFQHIEKTIERGKYYTIHGKFGEIKICPTCGILRDTSCSACGCGSCQSCSYRWSCGDGRALINSLPTKII